MDKKWKITFAVIGVLIVLGLFANTGSKTDISAQPAVTPTQVPTSTPVPPTATPAVSGGAGNWTQPEKNAIIQGCTQSGSAAADCTCAVNYLESKYTISQVMGMTGSDPRMLEAAASCLDTKTQ